MDTPLDLLEAELEKRKFLASCRGFSAVKKESAKMIPLYEEALAKLNNPTVKREKPKCCIYNAPNSWVLLADGTEHYFTGLELAETLFVVYAKAGYDVVIER